MNTHQFTEGYNFVECQQDVAFVHRILRSFGWQQEHIDDFYRNEHILSVDHIEDSDLNDEGIEVQTTKRRADVWIMSGEGALWELKSPNTQNGNPRPLTEQHRQQLLTYHAAFPGAIQPRYLILSNFRTFRIYDSRHEEHNIHHMVAEFNLEDLFENRGLFPFLNLVNPEAGLVEAQERIGDAAANIMADARAHLLQQGIDRSRATNFMMQCALLMYLEDETDNELNPVLPRAGTTRGPLHQLLIDISQNMETSPLLFAFMQEAGQQGDEGQYHLPLVSLDWYSPQRCVSFFIDETTIRYLLDLVTFDWSTINPTMFGSFIEAGFSPEERAAGGVQYTREPDIERIVEPLIDDYFACRIDDYVRRVTQQTHPVNWAEERRSRAIVVLNELYNFRVLEPAVGCGNFLFVAYQHLHQIESEILDIIYEVDSGYIPIERLSPRWMIGYEINEYSSEVARMVMAIADFDVRKWQFGNPLPLASGNQAATITCQDSLLDGDDIREWQSCDVIIGNPPFMGLAKIRQSLGGEYADRLCNAFGELAPNANIDLVCYFVLLASRMVEQSNCRAFGFITTHAIGGPLNRPVIRQALDYGLRIPFAYRRREWDGTAGVSISIFAMESAENPYLGTTRLAASFNGDIVDVDLPINEYLDIRDLQLYTNPIPGQNNFCFQAVKGGYIGRGESPLRLVLTDEEARVLLAANNGPEGPPNSDVVVRYVGAAYASDRELGWILNFRRMPLEEAAAYVQPFQFVHDTRRLGVLEWVDPANEDEPGPLGVRYSTKAAGYNMQDRWWTLRDPKEEWFEPLREQADHFYLKHQTYARESRSHLIHIERIPSTYTPDGTYYVFNFGDDDIWRIGVLLSGYYRQWSSITQGWTDNFGETWRINESFNGFPFPQHPDEEHVTAMNGAIEAYYNRITELEEQFDTFQEVLNAASLLPQRNALDQAVQAMYGFPNNDQVLSNLIEYKANVLLEIEYTLLEDSLQDLATIPRLGPAAVQRLTEAGILNYNQLIQAGVGGLTVIDGIGAAGAAYFIAYAEGVLNRLEEINQLLNP